LVVTGDTKVVGSGRGGGIFINTSGIGPRRADVDVHVSNARPDDDILITGTIGDHGIAVMSCREGIQFETELVSDVAPLAGLTGALLEAVPSVHCLRDPTRGGLAASLCDIAAASSVGIRVRESALPVKKEVFGACQLFGFDPLNVPNEGKAVVVCSRQQTARALEVLRTHPLGRETRVIGSVTSEHAGIVLLETKIGGERIVETPSGENLPRIC